MQLRKFEEIYREDKGYHHHNLVVNFKKKRYELACILLQDGDDVSVFSDHDPKFGLWFFVLVVAKRDVALFAYNTEGSDRKRLSYGVVVEPGHLINVKGTQLKAAFGPTWSKWSRERLAQKLSQYFS